MPHFARPNISLRCPQNVSVKFQLKIPMYCIILKMPEWKQKHSVFVPLSLNANELLLPAPFSRIGLCLYSSYLKYSAKKHLFDFDYVYRPEIMCFKPTSVETSDIWFSEHTHLKDAQRKCLSRI